MDLNALFALILAATTLGLPGSARAQSCAANVPHVTGTWVKQPYLMPINPISATLLHTGKILIVAGSENDADNYSTGAESYRAAVWDPSGPTESSITVQNLAYDVFCSGTAVLPDGRALVVGGTSSYAFTGDNRASIFNPATDSFVQSQDMVDGRWYGTATALGDGRIMAFSGLSDGGGVNNTVEIYSLTDAGNGWTDPVAAPFTPSLFPRMMLLPDGTVFFTGQGGGNQTGNSWRFDPVAERWTASAATTGGRVYGSAVLLPLLPPSYRPRVMNFGGSGLSSTEIIDLSAPSPRWTPGPTMSAGRIEMNATILPNGKVLAQGGSLSNEIPDTSGKTADLYDPASNSYGSGGTAAYSRLYHSTALLLPDATVMSIGSNPGGRGGYEPAIEIYSPPYLFDANDQLITARPTITGTSPASGVIGYNAPFSVTYTSAAPIGSAVLVRPGSSTHAFDMDQRLVGLCGPAPQPPCAGSGTLNLTSPPNGGIAPPGYYMLFLLDSAGVPSKAQFIKLSPYAAVPPSGVITSPASDVTIPAGGSVAFATGTAAAQYSWIFPSASPATSVAQTPGNVTFNTPGTYVASLTVIDSTGNSDHNPPTRTITVTPPTPDFSIAVTQPANEVVPGQSATFTVTVTPIGGFTGTVSLGVDSESGFPSGITSGGFNPASIAGAGSSTLTMNTTTSATPYALSLTVTGTSGTVSHAAATTLLVNLPPPASLTATAANAQVSLSWPVSLGASSYTVQRALVSGGALRHRRLSRNEQLHGRGTDQRHDLLLRRVGSLHGRPGRRRRERQLRGGKRDAAAATTDLDHGDAREPDGDGRRDAAVNGDGEVLGREHAEPDEPGHLELVEHGGGYRDRRGTGDGGRDGDDDDLGGARLGHWQYQSHCRGGAAHDHDHGASRGDGGSGLHDDPRGHGRDTALHVVDRHRDTAGGADPRVRYGGDLGHPDDHRDLQLHRPGDRRRPECDEGPQHRGQRADRVDLAVQPGPGDRGRGGPGGGGAGRQVPLRCRRDHQRDPLLQERRQHGDPRRQPVVDRRGESRHGNLHRRDGVGLAADELRDASGDPGQHGLRGVLFRAQRPLQRESRLLRYSGRGHAAAARAGKRRVGGAGRLRLRGGERLPGEHVPVAELLGGRGVQSGAVVHHHVEHDHLVHHDVDDELHYLIHDDIDYDDIVDKVHDFDHVEHHDLDDVDHQAADDHHHHLDHDDHDDTVRVGERSCM